MDWLVSSPPSLQPRSILHPYINYLPVYSRAVEKRATALSLQDRMASISSARKSVKIADVLQILRNPLTPEAAKQKTLRRLDGLEGRLAPIPKRRSLDNHDRGRVSTRTSMESDSSSGSSLRFTITEGVAPLSSAGTSSPYAGAPNHRFVMITQNWNVVY